MENSEFSIASIHRLVDLVDYVSGAVVVKAIMNKKTGSVTVSAFDMGEELQTGPSAFDCLIQIIDGEAEIVIGDNLQNMLTGEILIIPAHVKNRVRAKTRFKMLSTIIKSGYEDISL
ncbi:cupin domain-containing protein [Algoriphagus sp. SE2]|uniref:cupin domain-containing protein n=1 Tax=Algoriphagus sp. SE2 TaxID=3141536 RepID=UPI0031CCF232